MSRPNSWLVLCLAFICGTAAGQVAVPGASSAATSQPETKPDLLGRTTPRGAVLGFLRAAGKGDNESAAQYLNTHLSGKDANNLAHELFVVLDRRLPARLNELSDRPEGSLAFLTRPDVDLVGTVTNGKDKVDILLERVGGETNGRIWLFSRRTLDSIPDLYDAVNTISVERLLPPWLVHTRILQVALFEWLSVLLGLPVLYIITGLVGRGINPLVGRVRRRVLKDPDLANPEAFPRAARLLLMGLIIRWMTAGITLPLMARQFWSGTAATLVIVSSVRLFMLSLGHVEDVVRRRLERENNTGATAVLRLARRTMDLLAIFAGTLVILHYFGVKLTAALAGLGVGGIAVALAAQKTLENVIGGISIIFDKAVSVGDTLNTGNALGVIESIGLRSTRIRTNDRSIVSVPNGQLANLQLENLSVRDKFWFHPNIGLRYETTAEMMCSVLEGIRELLRQHPRVEPGSVRAHFLRFGAASLDIEVFAYLTARDFAHFMELQEDLLLQILRIVEAAGAQIAFPSQTMYLATDCLSRPGRAAALREAPTKEESRSVLY